MTLPSTASPSVVDVSATHQPVFWTDGMNHDAASKVSALLQENHEKHHIFFNERRFHNHIVHHLLSIFALGGSPADLQRAYSNNGAYQRPTLPVKSKVVSQLSDPKTFEACLGKEQHYGEFLAFFQSEMEKHGWQRVINTYLFANTGMSNDLFGRLFAGLLHPLIHLGFGIEFEPPVIIAEAMSQAAVHENWMSPILWKCEEALQRRGGPSKSMLQILDEIRDDKAIHDAVRWEDDNKLRDGLMVRASDHAANIVSQWGAKEDDLESKTLEMMSSVLYYAAASQNQRYSPKFDFITIHQTNSAIFYPRLLAAPYIPTEFKVRLLNWKGWADLLNYAARRAPKLMTPEQLAGYSPQAPGGWRSIFDRANRFADDGHAVKLVRAVAAVDKLSGGWKTDDGRDIWRSIGHLAIDSVEAPGPTWVRNCGWEEAWKDVPERHSEKL